MAYLYASYQLRLWRKHLLQHQILVDLTLPELGLFGGESSAEEALLTSLLKALGVPMHLRTETQRHYGKEQSRANARQQEILDKSQEETSFYLKASRLLGLFDQAVQSANIQENENFENIRDRLLYQSMLDLGVFYDILGHAPMRDAASLYDKGKGDFDRNISIEPPKGPLFREGDPFHIELHLEAFAHAQRVLSDIGNPQWISSLSNLSEAPATIRVQVHRFALLTTAVLGLPASVSTTLGFLQGARLIDQIVASRLQALIEKNSFAPEGDVSEEILASASETIRRLRLAVDAIEEAWKDGVLDPEETLILRYALLHLFGLSEETAARFIGTKETAKKLVIALRKLPE